MNELDLNTLKEFRPQLTNASNFLYYLNLNELDTLIKYLKKTNPEIAKILLENRDYKFIFHGNPMDFNSLTPKKSEGGSNKNRKKALVYATTIPDYAIFMACIHQKKDSFASVNQSGQYQVDLLGISDTFLNGESMISEGYVYVLSSKDFAVQPDNLSEWYSEKEVMPLFRFKTYFTELRTPISIIKQQI